MPRRCLKRTFSITLIECTSDCYEGLWRSKKAIQYSRCDRKTCKIARKTIRTRNWLYTQNWKKGPSSRLPVEIGNGPKGQHTFGKWSLELTVSMVEPPNVREGLMPSEPNSNTDSKFPNRNRLCCLWCNGRERYESKEKEALPDLVELTTRPRAHIAMEWTSTLTAFFQEQSIDCKCVPVHKQQNYRLKDLFRWIWSTCSTVLNRRSTTEAHNCVLKVSSIVFVALTSTCKKTTNNTNLGYNETTFLLAVDG